MARTIYDRFGFDKNGYNKDGFDRMGYDKNGYDKNGYDRSGYDIKGFDIDGFNFEGYDIDGFDRDGFDNHGYDRQGFDRNGYNKKGYDKEGFNKDGYNEKGYNRVGVDKFGYNYRGININGYDIYGQSESGYNVIGYDRNGFDKEGLDVYGIPKSSYDENGFNIYTGYNLNGFDRDGFNINGIDYDGYDREGFHFKSGLDKDGYNRDGFSKTGYDRNGFDKRGYDRNGFNKEGYNRDGFDINGFDEKGYDADGYDKDGYDIYGYNKSGVLKPSLQEKEISKSMDSNEYKLESQYLTKCKKQIDGYYRKQVTEDVMKEFKPIERTWIDRWGFYQGEVIQPNKAVAEREINKRVGSVLANPYFCHIDYRLNPDLYLGKQAVHGWITDWADEQASLYYQYQIYIGEEETDLKFVRDIMISKGKLSGYKDLYNKNEKDNKISEIADEHLARIIELNQKNKKIHDIIESIQRNQYEIITADKDKSSLVLGCAGSGKTMILMHRIRYMKYNNPDLDMNNIIVITPTDILGKESRELSEILQISNIQQFTTASFYENYCKKLMQTLKIDYEDFSVTNEIIDDDCYEEYYIQDLKYDLLKCMDVNLQKEKNSFHKKQEKEINNLLEELVLFSGLDEKIIKELYKLYESTLKEIERAGEKDLIRIIRQIKNDIEKYDSYYNTKEIVSFLLSGNIFKSTEEKTVNNNIDENKMDTGSIYDSEMEMLFFRTSKLALDVNYSEFQYVIQHKDIVPSDSVNALQIIQIFCEKTRNFEEVKEILSEWDKITKTQAQEYLIYAENRMRRIDELSNKERILHFLIDNNFVKKKSNENNSIKADTSFEKLLKIYEITEECFEEKGITPFSFFEQYDKINRRKRRLHKHYVEKVDKAYLYDAILELLGIEYKTDSKITIPVSKAFCMTILLNAYCPTTDEEKKYIFIDEFQDFATIELNLISTLYPSSVVNLYGDPNQCISYKGISDYLQVPKKLYEDKPYIINENYRNARQITEFTNKYFNMNMLPVGLDGVQKIVKIIPEIAIDNDDRVAVIISDINDDYYINSETDVNYYVKTSKIVRGEYNIIPVSMVKGLEFEKVIVIKKGMRRNEFYVACTRAISELYVVYEDDTVETENTQEDRNQKIDKDTDPSTNIYEKKDNSYQYKVVPYTGKLKKIAGGKKLPVSYITLNTKGIAKKIPISLDKETHVVFIAHDVYIRHAIDIEDYFQKTKFDNLYNNNDSVYSYDDKDNPDQLNQDKYQYRDLKVSVFNDTKSVPLMDKFEGINNDKPYDRLIIQHALIISDNEYKFQSLDLVIERSRSTNFEGDITFTQFKKGETHGLVEYIKRQVNKEIIEKYKASGEMFKFEKPYLFRAQNSGNRTGYGWEWDWTDRYDPIVYEGTLYGETTNYIISGVYFKGSLLGAYF